MAQRQYFTVEQANRALVLVRKIVSDIVGGYRRLMDLQEILEAAQTDGTGMQCEPVRRDLIQMVEKLQACLEELDDVGVELKDWSLGILDFPCIFDGREILLSWQHGEPAIGYWHQSDEGFGARQPIGTLMMEQMAGTSLR